MIEDLEMQLIAAMAASPETYHEAINLGADRILQTTDALYCIQQFDPTTGEFDAGALVANPVVLQSYLSHSSDIHGPIGSFRVRRMVQRIRAAYQQSRMLRVAQSITEDPEDQLNSMSSCVLELGALADNGESEAKEIEAALDDIDRRAEGKRGGDVMDWPLDWLMQLGAIGRQEFVVIGGRPGGGKSALMGQICYEYAKAGNRCMYITLEMSRNELRHRFTAYQCGYSVKRLDGLDPSKHRKYRAAFANIAGSDRLLLREHYSIGAIVSAISREKLRGLDAVFIDYLQLIMGKKGASRLEQLSDITRQIKIIAKDLRTPIFCGSQLNRASEDKDRPSLSSLRESGTIEQDADRVLLIHETQAGHEIMQAKCRNGTRHILLAKLNGETTSFEPRLQ